MLKYIIVFILSLSFINVIDAQEVTATNDIQPGSTPNEYNIKTTIKGLAGVDIARIKYYINNNHTYKASPNNALFSDRNESYIKFYIMAVPPSGIINVEFGLILGNNGENSFKVEFQYSKNEVKQTINLPQISFPEGNSLVVEEEPTPVVEEEEVVEIPEPTPVVEEEEVVETPEPTNTNSRISDKYTVQLLSLLEFSESRLKIYCKQHNLSLSDVKKRKVGEWMKITYGEANSIQEANQIKDKLARNNGINESFVTKVK